MRAYLAREEQIKGGVYVSSGGVPRADTTVQLCARQTHDSRESMICHARSRRPKGVSSFSPVYRRLVHVRILVAFMSCREREREREKKEHDELGPCAEI